MKNMTDTYKIIRYHREKPTRVISKGLSLEEAKYHCSLKDTHKFNKEGNVIWFDGYTKEE